MTKPITLVPVSSDSVSGIYGGRLPARMLWLQPDTAQSFNSLCRYLVLSDMYRSAQGSLDAMQAKTGVQPPAFSRHGYGRAIDLDIIGTLKRGSFGDKAALDRFMEAHGWYCHRRDHILDSEAWHYNFLPGGLDIHAGEISSAGCGERELQSLFAAFFAPDDIACQTLLGVEPDGKIGTQTRQALHTWQAKWIAPCHLHAWQAEFLNNELGPITRRTLAFVSAGAPHA